MIKGFFIKNFVAPTSCIVLIFNLFEYTDNRMVLLIKIIEISKKIEPIYKTIGFKDVIQYLDLIGSRKTVGRIVAVK